MFTNTYKLNVQTFGLKLNIDLQFWFKNQIANLVPSTHCTLEFFDINTIYLISTNRVLHFGVVFVFTNTHIDFG